MKRALITEYELPDGLKIKSLRQKSGGRKWAVTCSFGFVLNNRGEMELDHQPSNRDNGFLLRCRFDSADDAYQVWERYRAANDSAAEPETKKE